MKPILWSPLFRLPAFLALFLVGYALSYLLPIISTKSKLGLLRDVIREVGRGEFGGVGHSEFAFALACAIVSTAAAIAFAMFLMHVVLLRISLHRARRHLGASAAPKAFLNDFDRINQRLGKHPLIGHAWEEFAKTCVRRTSIVRTARPGAFLSPAAARERLPGLKLMPTIPGYFVGLGLLLTFVGLVIALSKAAAGVTGSPENMTQALRELLDAATFKFSTSIAGLFSSLALAFLFKVYAIIIEDGFERFCREVERRTTLLTTQDALLDLADAGKEQLQQLKEINDVQFFDRLGQTLGPALASAVEGAVKPLADQLQATVGKLEDTSRSGTEGLLKQFSDTLHGTAGTELKELAVVLGQTKDALGSVRGDLSGSGQEFAQRMSEATETLGRLIAGAGDQFSANNAASRETVEAILAALKQSADATKERLNQDVAEAGTAASAAMKAGMAGMLSQVQDQMAAFQATMTSLQQQAARDAEESSAKSKGAAEAAAAAAGKAAADTAEAIRTGFAEIVSQLRGDVDRLSAALRATEQSFEAQHRASLATVEQTNLASAAFGKVANDVNGASRPLLQASDRIATSTDALAEAAKGAAESLRVGQEAARTLAVRLEEGNRQIEAAWRNYEERFGAVDEAMSKAVQSLAVETANQQQLLSDFVVKIDEGCARAVQGLQTATGSIEQNTSDISEIFEEFLGRMPRQAMANA